MVRTYKKKTERAGISECDISKAIHDVLKKNMSIREAAIMYNISKSTIHKRIQKAKKLEPLKGDTVSDIGNDNDIADTSSMYKFGSKYSSQQVFTSEEEEMLASYLIKSSQIQYGLTYVQARVLGFKYAEALNKKFPESWKNNKMAGIDWMKSYMNRHSNLSLRRPENTSLSRATAFNANNVDAFFKNYLDVMARYKFIPSRILNFDESGISTVLPSPKVISESGKKQVGQAVSGERGELVTFCGIITATGSTIPPVYIFPRVRYKNNFLKGGPSGSLGLSSKSGWMTQELFVEALKHIQKHTQSTKENPILLLLDNHDTHASLEAIIYAKENGIVVLSFPPHCSHRMQPLDVGVYSSFKGKIKIAFNDWLASNPGKTITIYEIAELSSNAYLNSFTPKNINSSFKNTGIWPVNRLVFSDEDFLPAFVTDRPNPVEISQDVEIEHSDSPSTEPKPSTSTFDHENLIEAGPSTRIFSPEVIRPFPKAPPRKNQSTRKGKSRIYTDTPEKERIEQITTAKMEKVKINEERRQTFGRKRKFDLEKSKKEIKIGMMKRQHCQSKIQSLSESDDEVESKLDDVPQELKLLLDDESLDVNDFVLVRFNTKSKAVYFIGRIEKKLESYEYEVKYLRKKVGKQNVFNFPDKTDESIIERRDIVAKLPPPIIIGETERTAANLTFMVNLESYKVE